MKLSIIFHVVSQEKQAVYVNNERLLVGDDLTAIDLSNLLVEHTPFTFTQKILHKEIESFPFKFSEFEDELKNPYMIELWDSVSFTTTENGRVVYGCGTVLNIVRDENDVVSSYTVKDVKTHKEFEITPYLSGEEKIFADTILLSIHDEKYSKLPRQIIGGVNAERKEILTPSIGEAVSYKTDKGCGKGIVEYVFVHEYADNVYRCKVRREDGAIVEVYHGNRRYPEDGISWDKSPIYLSSENDWLNNKI